MFQAESRQVEMASQEMTGGHEMKRQLSILFSVIKYLISILLLDFLYEVRRDVNRGTSCSVRCVKQNGLDLI